MHSRTDLDSIHAFCWKNRELLERSELAGCFYCCEIFAPAKITTWIPEIDPATRELGTGVTAACPYCAVDSVLPSAAPIQLDAPLLKAMHSRWF